MKRTDYFDAIKKDPEYPGRYLYKYRGDTRPVFRWWNGSNWQLNRRKAVFTKPAAGDQWAGAVELHPEVKAMLDSGAATSNIQPVKLQPTYYPVRSLTVRS